MHPVTVEAPRRATGLDAVRGLAVAGVVAYHVWPDAVPGGFLGVDIFFVLSGFLITRGLVASTHERGSDLLRAFWIRRTRRILPGLFGVLLIGLAAARLAGGDAATRLRGQALGAITFSSNWYQVHTGQSYFDRDSPPMFQHLWSLAVEEQFYLVWPVLALILIRTIASPARRCAAVIAIALLSIVAMIVMGGLGATQSRLYFGTDTHGFALLLGAALGLAAPSLWSVQPRLLGRLTSYVVLVAGAVVCVRAFLTTHDTASSTYPGALARIDLVVMTMVIPAALLGPSPIFERWLGPLRWLGLRSYGLYLWHWPVVVLARQAGIPASAQGRTAWSLAVVAISLALAEASWRLLEKPVLTHGWRGCASRPIETLGRRPWQGLTAAVPMILAVALAGSALSGSSPISTTQARIDAGRMAIAAAEAHPTPEPGQAPVRHPATVAPHHARPTKRTQPTQPTRPTRPTQPTQPTQPTGPTRPVHQAPLGPQVSLIGDSVTLASAPALLAALPGVSIHAAVGEQLWDAPRTIAQLRSSGDLRRYVVLALGTNGDVRSDTLARTVAAAGPDHEFVLVTAHGPRSWIPSVDEKIRGYARAHPQTTALADWDSAAHQVTDFSDGIHPGASGGRVWADVVKSALARLAGGQAARP